MVLPDADLDIAVEVAIEAMFYNQGEACTSTARILVHGRRAMTPSWSVHRCRHALVVGDGLDPRTDIGPMVDAKQRDRVLAYLQTALDEGARIVGQGTVPDDATYADGY